MKKMINAMNYKEEGIWEIGTFTLGNEVDITDPCYDYDTWCRMTTECKPGEYTAYIKVSNTGDWGNIVEYIAIYKDNETDYAHNGQMHTIGSIGVDSGCAGFFNNKPNYNDEEWYSLVDEMNPNENNVYVMPYGIFSDSGYGDGEYWVYANKERSAFGIRFIDDGNENVFYAN
jgi:hypothetical protein